MAALSKISLHSPDRHARALALILLAAITWGATVAVNHHHGASASTLTIQDEQDLSQRLESSDKPTPSNRNNLRDDCLICRLHQNLLATALRHAVHETPATTQFLQSTASLIFHQAQSPSSEYGRAPPNNP